MWQRVQREGPLADAMPRDGADDRIEVLARQEHDQVITHRDLNGVPGDAPTPFVEAPIDHRVTGFERFAETSGRRRRVVGARIRAAVGDLVDVGDERPNVSIRRLPLGFVLQQLRADRGRSKAASTASALACCSGVASGASCAFHVERSSALPTETPSRDDTPASRTAPSSARASFIGLTA